MHGATVKITVQHVTDTNRWLMALMLQQKEWATEILPNRYLTFEVTFLVSLCGILYSVLSVSTSWDTDDDV